MSIEYATEHLAIALLSHYEASDPACKPLREIARIRSYGKDGKLADWEKAVLASVNDLEASEQRHDVPLIEAIWEVGRFNLFGAIQERQTRDLYLSAARLLKETHGIQVKGITEFDFPKW